MYAFFGSIIFGVAPLTGPTAESLRLRNTYARHDVIRGKPVLQPIGQELDERNISFFFDETFCVPEAEWARLLAAYQARQPAPLVYGASYGGKRFVVETLEQEVQKVSRSGRVVRLASTMSLIEAPVTNYLSFALNAAAAIAPALGAVTGKPAALR
ncbi:phage tail protein [Xanthobacter sp. VTT E-85241]|uniref:phage tail protein n=1 Tax=Roseixanthobacter finlandensis TaxID=3119922 RepID=UPI003726A2AB